MVIEWDKQNQPFGGTGQIEYAEHSAHTKAKKTVEVSPTPVSDDSEDGHRWKAGEQVSIGDGISIAPNKAYRVVCDQPTYIVLWDSKSGIITPVPDAGDFLLPANTPIVIQSQHYDSMETAPAIEASGIIQAVEVK